VVINGINAAIDQALEALGYVPKLIHRAASVRDVRPTSCLAVAGSPHHSDQSKYWF